MLPLPPAPHRPPGLWLLRHAQPRIAAGVCYGRLDVEAEPLATLQAAQRIIQALSEHGHTPPNGIRASGMPPHRGHAPAGPVERALPGDELANQAQACAHAPGISTVPPPGQTLTTTVRHSPLRRCVQLAHAVQALHATLSGANSATADTAGRCPAHATVPPAPTPPAYAHTPAPPTHALKGHTLALQADARLQEMDFGCWEGMPWAHIAQADIDHWANDLAHHAPGGGEPLWAMLHRVQAALAHSWQADGAHGTRDALWITHAGVVRCVQWLLRHGGHMPAKGQVRGQDWNLPTPACGAWVVLPWQTVTDSGALAAQY